MSSCGLIGSRGQESRPQGLPGPHVPAGTQARPASRADKSETGRRCPGHCEKENFATSSDGPGGLSQRVWPAARVPPPYAALIRLMFKTGRAASPSEAFHRGGSQNRLTPGLNDRADRLDARGCSLTRVCRFRKVSQYPPAASTAAPATAEEEPLAADLVSESDMGGTATSCGCGLCCSRDSSREYPEPTRGKIPARPRAGEEEVIRPPRNIGSGSAAVGGLNGSTTSIARRPLYHW